ncbi:MAG: radical SAM protein [Synergistaceae bacterium]|jgi:cytidyltransferase-like protein|nr:radical SAM protein [Synergistaceae bacterium]
MNLQERVSLKKADREDLYCIEPPFPRTNFLIETSNACNHKCIFCAHQKMRRKVGKISPELVFNLLKQAYDLGTREVGFYSTGEPFLAPELPEYIKKAKEIGYEYVYLTTNGALATPERIRGVIDAGLDSIKFSINAPERKMYEFIHGKDDFDTVVEHLRYLNYYREQSNKKFKIFVTGILTRYTEDMKDDYFIVFKGLADEIVFKNVYNQGGYMPEVETLLKCKSDNETYRRCNLPFDAISVTYEGYLSVENADYENMLTVADLNKVTLKDAWYGEKMKKIRQAFIDDDLTGLICDGCVHHKVNYSAEPVTPEHSSFTHDYFSREPVKERIAKEKLVYVPMAVDIVHPGHINIIKAASELGRVMVGLFSDEAISSYKKPPLMNYEARKIVIENIKGVDEVVVQNTRDYEPNLRKYRPDYMVHGTDWRIGPLSDVRAKAIGIMAEWGGKIVEPEYTQGVSSSELKQKMSQQ